ncbi:MAG: type III secretion system ATPase SctN [Candidatus Eisenbacteria bacterium]|uniref:Type 3 secretion system ATPase n=1 Tax=Eiseniibacteriota bacterium TaxID=2212470 RepID=A0A956NBC3_UNCEI|nr:type III secretion system ATPase SctN [Candidatus Eisenbacteria bacterium]MCB9463950.1 type III secretion system ATPase SctN [Candidatus Eisenbacteria bacterium]
MEVRGRVTGLVGIIVKAALPEAWVGELCYIKNPHSDELVRAEVVGFDRHEALLMPLGELANIGMASEVIPTGRGLVVKVGDALLGRVVNGLGEPRDLAERGPLQTDQEYPVMAAPPDPLVRKRIQQPLPIGIKAVDGILTVGEGQRVGLFAAAGGGKSTFLGMVARNTAADVNVIALIGERGREVNDFIEESLGPEGMARSVVVVATSDEPSLVRLKAAYVAQAIADYFRDQGKKVMLMMDSVTRFARAQREVGLAAGEPPARAGFTPSVFSELPKLLERSGNSDKGSITAFYTVLVEGDDMTEPVADEVRSILDGHIILTRRLAAAGHYPAIDIGASASRVFPAVTQPDHQKAAARLRELLSLYEENRDAITYGIYKRGTDAKLDEAIAKIDAITGFLRQGTGERVAFDDSLSELSRI